MRLICIQLHLSRPVASWISVDFVYKQLHNIAEKKDAAVLGAPPPPPIIFERFKLPPTNYISSEREFIGDSESSKILGKYFDFAIL